MLEGPGCLRLGHGTEAANSLGGKGEMRDLLENTAAPTGWGSLAECGTCEVEGQPANQAGLWDPEGVNRKSEELC